MARIYKRQEIKVGDRFGRLEVIGETYSDTRSGQVRSRCPCVCECGEKADPEVYNLTTGRTRSCGCLGREIVKAGRPRHGLSHTQIHNTWCAIKQRCYTPKYPNYHDYGGRGIRVCPEWLASFEAFRDWAMANGYRDGLTIERKDVNGNYCPENCEWIPVARQALNRRTSRRIPAFGEVKTLIEWLRDPRCEIDRTTFYQRKRSGMSDEEAITTPNKRPYLRRCS